MIAISRRNMIAGLGAATLPMPTFARQEGEKWQTLPTEPFKGKQDDISFIDLQTGWYGNGSGKLFQTLNGGDSWVKIWERPGTFIRSLGFLDASRGFLGNVGTDYYPGVTDPNPLYRTNDGGRTWTAVKAPGIKQVAGICGIDILPVPRIYQGERRTAYIVHAAGRVGGPTAVMRSEDDGESFTVFNLRDHASMILDVKFHSESVGFLAASSPGADGQGEALILRTVDGCQTWQPVYRSGRSQENVWKMSWPTPLVGYATVQSYDDKNRRRVFVKTVDGGRSWKEHPLTVEPKMQEFGIGFVDHLRGWIGCAGSALETQNGGHTWMPADIGKAVNKIRIIRGEGRTRLFAIGLDVHRLDMS